MHKTTPRSTGSWLKAWAIILGLQPLPGNLDDMQWRAWKKVLYQTRQAIGDKNVAIYAAGIAFFGTLAFFPMMALVVSVTALFIQPERFQSLIDTLNVYLPNDFASLISSQLSNLIDKPEVSLPAAVIALLIALWGVSGAIENLIRALNNAYEVKETRSFVRLRSLSILLTLGTIVGLLIVLPMMAVTGDWLRYWGAPDTIISIFSVVRWVLLMGVTVIVLDVLYYAGPNLVRRWRWLSWGSIVATILWMVTTAAFFIYARYFAHFSDVYSLFAGIIVLMIWLNVSMLTILIGAEVNRIIESKK